MSYLNTAIIVFLLIFTPTLSHFPPHCRCVCHITRDALFKARNDCFLPGSGTCMVRLCRNHNFAGFACCMPDISPDPLLPLTSRTPLPSPLPVAPMESQLPLMPMQSPLPLGPMESPLPNGALQSPLPVASMELEGPMEVIGGMDDIGDDDHDDGDHDHEDDDHDHEHTPEMDIENEEAMGTSEATEVFMLPTPSFLPHLATIRFAADDEAMMYVNGMLISSINDWTAYATISMQLFVGDVIGIEVRDIGGRWHGVIVSIDFADQSYLTGRDEWRAVKWFEEGEGEGGAWKSRTFDGCDWPLAMKRENEDVWVPGKSISFPYDNGAKYVWAGGMEMDDMEGGGGVFLRLVIGGASC